MSDVAVPITPQDEQIATERWLPKINAADTLDQLTWREFSDALDIALSRKDARLIGQLFLAAREFKARRIALTELHGKRPDDPTPDRVVADVFVKATTAANRRLDRYGVLLAAIEHTLTSVRFAKAAGASYFNLNRTEALLERAVKEAKS
jgi:hypothetical protein